MGNPSTGIVVPAYRGERFLGRTLDAILAQTETDWECVVVDDGSPDGTRDIVGSYARRDSRIRLVGQANEGVSAARNRGFQEISPSVQYVSFMDQDDVWVPEALAILRARIEGSPGCIGAHGLADMIDGDDNPIKPGEFVRFLRGRRTYDGRKFTRLGPADPTTFASLIYGGRLYPPGLILARRSAYEKVGPWDCTLRLVQDWDMTIRLSRLGCFEYIDEVILYYRRHETNGSDDTTANAREIRRLQYKTFFSPENSQAQQLLMRKAWKAWQVHRIKEKGGLVGPSIRDIRLVEAGRLLIHIAVHSLRFARGCPSSSGV